MKPDRKVSGILRVGFWVKTDFVQDEDDVRERVPAWLPEVGDEGLSFFCFAEGLVGDVFGDDLPPEFFLRVMVPREVKREKSNKVLSGVDAIRPAEEPRAEGLVVYTVNEMETSDRPGMVACSPEKGWLGFWFVCWMVEYG